MIGFGGPLGVANSPVRVMKKQLRSIGFQLADNGIVDAPTVTAINAILVGWDDAGPAGPAPARLKTGTLKAPQIQRELRTITVLVRRAVGTSVGFDNLPE